MINELTLPNGRLPDAGEVGTRTKEALAERVRELEALCAEVYIAAVEIGLPQPLLDRLWTVAAQGSAPHAYHIELPSPPAALRPVTPAQEAAPPAIPHMSMSQSLNGPDAEKIKQPELKTLGACRTVLVVDDDPMMLDVLVRILQRENYHLLTAPNGQRALDVLDETGDRIDLLVTDYAMPEMHGRELAERVRGQNPDLKVLYQTGFSDMLFQDRVELEEGAAFLEKPFTARGLREAARMILFGTFNPD